MLNLKIIIGSTWPGRGADHVIPWITGRASDHGAFAVEVLDLRDWPLPLFTETFTQVNDSVVHGPRSLACLVGLTGRTDAGHPVRSEILGFYPERGECVPWSRESRYPAGG